MNKLKGGAHYIVQAKFKNGRNSSVFSTRVYDFLCNIPVFTDDLIVVDTVHGPQLAIVMGVKVSSELANRWVICRVEHPQYNQMQIDAIEDRKDILERAIDTRANALRQEVTIKELAETDQVLKMYLEEYERLTNVNRCIHEYSFGGDNQWRKP